MEKSHRYRLRLGLEFLKSLEKRYPSHKLNTRLSALDGEMFHGYFDWRLSVTKAKRQNDSKRRCTRRASNDTQDVPIREGPEALRRKSYSKLGFHCRIRSSEEEAPWTR